MEEQDSQVENSQVENHEPSEAEVKARRAGWVSKEEWKGDPEQWRDADTFNKRGEEIHGYLKADLDRLHTTLSQRDRDIAEMREAMEEFRKFHNETESRAYKRALDELKAQKAEAIQLGEGAKVVELDDQIAQVVEAQKQTEKKVVSKNSDQINREYQEWLPQNQWYISDPELAQVAEDFGDLIKKRNPSLVGKEFLEEVTKKVKNTFPEKFENPARKTAAVGTSSESRPTGGKEKKSYESLPAEAKAACDKFVKQGLMTKEQYVAEYDWD